MNGRDLEGVSLPLGVSADEESMDRVILSGRTSASRKSVSGRVWKVEGKERTTRRRGTIAS